MFTRYYNNENLFMQTCSITSILALARIRISMLYAPRFLLPAPSRNVDYFTRTSFDS